MNTNKVTARLLPETAEKVLRSAGVITHCTCTRPKAAGPLSNFNEALPINPFSGSPT